ncbi:hypothetical protein [Endozoicomonas sp. GU-1]|uniref:hypothetical protein n=1 Tax=Endozoicomonas sp. GU-1 TaxID=3009078 RepID=UPI0022B46932|nr:hypothetical protein [Endozoicomonas sp. GU-1]WBA80845.1 hypothetical protein O2T12_21445 [Endozoicomonas sp. GU-1]WBA88407.1 hypothetical protein O3276_10630 [Endozoicomonas sp. GU-1]
MHFLTQHLRIIQNTVTSPIQALTNIYCKKPEQGILDACHDAGFLASMGLILTSMLPAFHNTVSTRRWIALHNAFNERNGVHPGTFGAWNTDATGKPDLGYCGIRDIGDYEFFGQIKSLFQHKDTNDCTHTFHYTKSGTG